MSVLNVFKIAWNIAEDDMMIENFVASNRRNLKVNGSFKNLCIITILNQDKCQHGT